MKTTQQTTKKGMTLVELIVAISIITITMSGFTLLFLRVWRAQGFAIEMGISSLIASRGLEKSIDHIRNARRSEAGAFPIISANDKEFVFYADYDRDGIVERVRYFGEDQQFKVGITEPNLNTLPVTYGGSETIRTLASDVMNGVTHNADNCLRYQVTSDIDGTPASRFTTIGMAHNVGNANEYFFDLDGSRFRTQVTSDGWVLVASGNGGDNENGYEATSSLGYNADKTLSSTVFAALDGITEVRIEATDQEAIWRNPNNLPFDVTTTNSSVISRLKAYNTLGYSSATNAVWTGDSNARMAISCDGGSGDLNDVIYHACGNSTGMHWIPGTPAKREQVNYSSNWGWPWSHWLAENDLNLYVRAPGESAVFSFTASRSDIATTVFTNDDPSDTTTYTEAELHVMGGLCIETDNANPDEAKPLFEYFSEFNEFFANDVDGIIEYDEIRPRALTAPVNITDINLVKVMIHVNPDPYRAPDNIKIQSYVTIRNLSNFDNISQ